jgi:hypothetical protein
MSNPWVYSPTDLALAPLKLFLSSFQLQNNVNLSELSKNSSLIDENEKTFVDMLREADEINAKMRSDILNKRLDEMYKENDKAINNIATIEFNTALIKLTESLRAFLDKDLLEKLYQHLLNINRNIKDDMAPEKKAKLVSLIILAEKKIQRISSIKNDPYEDSVDEENVDKDKGIEVDAKIEADDNFPLNFLFDIISDFKSKLKKFKINTEVNAVNDG